MERVAVVQILWVHCHFAINHWKLNERQTITLAAYAIDNSVYRIFLYLSRPMCVYERRMQLYIFLCSWRGFRSQLIERAFDLIVHIIKHIFLHTLIRFLLVPLTNCFAEILPIWFFQMNWFDALFEFYTIKITLLTWFDYLLWLNICTKIHSKLCRFCGSRLFIYNFLLLNENYFLAVIRWKCIDSNDFWYRWPNETRLKLFTKQKTTWKINIVRFRSHQAIAKP